MIRQYVKSNLYDRISTRPFLTPIEKKWLAFQLLCALNQVHQQEVSPGTAGNLPVYGFLWSISIFALRFLKMEESKCIGDLRIFDTCRFATETLS